MTLTLITSFHSVKTVIMDLTAKSVLVVGLARTGMATAKFLKAKGSLVTHHGDEAGRGDEGGVQELKGMDLSMEWGGHRRRPFSDRI